MHYAIEKLHFPIHNIVIFAWSIGGYSACWTAVHYPDIHGLILDAIFDDVLPLAQRQMPTYTKKFVEKTIRYYLDLNNIQLLKLYNGPFYLIRRTQDEVMNLISGKFQSNRANEILFHILPYRYPFIYNNNKILTLLQEYIYSNKIQQIILYEKYCSDKDNLQLQTEKYRLKNPNSSYPCKFGLY
jgi:pimeloyl-ACP methyl ester carboxylesterase